MKNIDSIYEQVKVAWNKQADGYNQWFDLDEQVKLAYAFKIGKIDGLTDKVDSQVKQLADKCYEIAGEGK